MPLLSIFTAIGQIFWPFIKESLLREGTLRDFVRKNRTTCFWLVLMLFMLGAQIFLFDVANTARNNERTAVTRLNSYAAHLTLLRQQYTLLETDRNAYRDKAKELQKELDDLTASHGDLTERVDRYEGWLQRCGVDLDYTGTNPPQCRARAAATRPKPRPKPPVTAPPVILPEEHKEPKKPTFMERLRGIFKGKDKEEP